MPSPLCRILYVEDEPDIRAVAQMALEAVGGFAVIACAAGQETLSVAPDARADLLLLATTMAVAAENKPVYVGLDAETR